MRIRFSRPVRSSSTEAICPVTEIWRRTASPSRDDVVAEHVAPSRVGPQQRREDLDRRRLAGAVGPEHAVDGAQRDLQVDAVDGAGRAERLDQALGLDGEGGHRLGVVFALQRADRAAEVRVDVVGAAGCRRSGAAAPSSS